MMTLWLHFGCEQIVFKPDGSQFNLRKMHCSLLPRRSSAATALAASIAPAARSIAALRAAAAVCDGGSGAVKLSE